MSKFKISQIFQDQVLDPQKILYNAYWAAGVSRDQITLAVLELLEGGVLTKLETKWWLENGQCGYAQGTPKKVSVFVHYTHKEVVWLHFHL